MLNCIDFHTHIFPEHVAAKALDALIQAYGAQPQGPATVNFIPLGAMHPDLPDQEAEIAFLRDQGVPGVKLQPHFQGYELDAPSTLKMFEKLSEMIILIHAGQEIRPIPHVPTTPERLRALHDRFPAHRLVLAHLGGYQMWDGVEKYLIGESVHLDLAYTFSHLDDEAIARLIAAHGPERILFASDYPWQTPAEACAGLKRLQLPEEQEHMILVGNAARLLGI